MDAETIRFIGGAVVLIALLAIQIMKRKGNA